MPLPEMENRRSDFALNPKTFPSYRRGLWIVQKKNAGRENKSSKKKKNGGREPIHTSNRTLPLRCNIIKKVEEAAT